VEQHKTGKIEGPEQLPYLPKPALTHIKAGVSCTSTFGI
jgi:hypothetical protein